MKKSKKVSSSSIYSRGSEYTQAQFHIELTKEK